MAAASSARSTDVPHNGHSDTSAMAPEHTAHQKGFAVPEATVSFGAMKTDADLEGQIQEQENKKKGLKATTILAYAAVGVIFGDIGTSPLYTYSSTFQNGIGRTEDIFGVASLIFWSLTLIVIIKYCLITLECGDRGEGGTFALFSLLCRYTSIAPADLSKPMQSDIALSRYSSVRNNPRANRTRLGVWLRHLFTNSALARRVLLSLVLLMTSLVLGDAILTPAQSVLGAIYGLQYKEPQLSQGTIVGVSCAIIILLFAAQRFGTMRLGSSFAPIVLLWFLFNVIVAIYNINKYYPPIFKCMSPQWAYSFFKHNRHTGWEMLAGIFLSVTGAEATFADLGHFSVNAIRMAFICVAYPALVLTYFGQAAWLTQNQDAVSSTFYASIPFGDGFYWVFFAIATAAACVASQTMISAAFSLLRQSMMLGCFPRLTIVHTSNRVRGQVYIPEVNWVLMILCVIIVAVFKTTTELGNAYGVAVSAMMLGTTFLVTLVMLIVWGVNEFVALSFLLVFGFIDGVYLSANLNKIPHGGWFTIAVAGVVCIVSHIWHHGMTTKHTHEAASKKMLGDYIEGPPEDADKDQAADQLILRSTGAPILRTPGISLFYFDNPFSCPEALLEHLQRTGSLADCTIILTVRKVAVTSVAPKECLLVQQTPLPGVYRCVARYGFNDRVVHDGAFVATLLAEIERLGSLPATARPALDNGAFFITRPRLVPSKDKSWGNLAHRLVISCGYNPISKYLAQQPWTEWNITSSCVFEVHCKYVC